VAIDAGEADGHRFENPWSDVAEALGLDDSGNDDFEESMSHPLRAYGCP